MGDEFRYCELGVTLVGADLDRLADRKATNGVVIGSAALTGVYRDETITVSTQAAQKPAPSGVLDDSVPCRRPPGGWLTGADPHPALDAVARYRRSHPGSIVSMAYLNPSRRESLVYVLTSGDPEPVRAALAPTYGTGLCVQKSDYSAKQIATARQLVTGLMRTGPTMTRPYEGGGIGLNAAEQPSVGVSALMIDVRLANTLDSQPAGLIEIAVAIARSE
jgi:hypothetical protein